MSDELDIDGAAKLLKKLQWINLSARQMGLSRYNAAEYAISLVSKDSSFLRELGFFKRLKLMKMLMKLEARSGDSHV